MLLKKLCPSNLLILNLSLNWLIFALQKGEKTISLKGRLKICDITSTKVW